MTSSKNKSPPPRDPAWRSVAELDAAGASGGIHAIRIRVECLREQLIQKFIDDGIGEGEAARRVDEGYVGERMSPSGGGRGLYASPEAVAMLDLQLKLPRAAKDWRSAGQLAREGKFGGNCARIASKMQALRSELIDDVTEVGVPMDEASSLVDGNLIGHRRTGFADQEALFASPGALRILNERHPPKENKPNKRGR